MKEFHPLPVAACLASLPDPNSLEDGGRIISELCSCQMLTDEMATSLLPSLLWVNLCLPALFEMQNFLKSPLAGLLMSPANQAQGRLVSFLFQLLALIIALECGCVKCLGVVSCGLEGWKLRTVQLSHPLKTSVLSCLSQ